MTELASQTTLKILSELVHDYPSLPGISTWVFIWSVMLPSSLVEVRSMSNWLPDAVPLVTDKVADG